MWSESWFSLNPGQRDARLKRKPRYEQLSCASHPNVEIERQKTSGKLIREARIARSRRRGNTANTEEVQEGEEEGEGEGNNSDTNDV